MVIFSLTSGQTIKKLSRQLTKVKFLGNHELVGVLEKNCHENELVRYDLREDKPVLTYPVKGWNGKIELTNDKKDIVATTNEGTLQSCK